MEFRTRYFKNYNNADKYATQSRGLIYTYQKGFSPNSGKSQYAKPIKVVPYAKDLENKSVSKYGKDLWD